MRKIILFLGALTLLGIIAEIMIFIFAGEFNFVGVGNILDKNNAGLVAGLTALYVTYKPRTK